MSDKFEPNNVLAAAFGISSLGGLAALLRSKQQLTWRNVFAAFLWSGLSGLLIGLTWYNYFNDQGNIYFLLAVSGLAGIGNMTVTDLVFQMLKAGGISITISSKSEKDKEPPKEKNSCDIQSVIENGPQS